MNELAVINDFLSGKTEGKITVSFSKTDLLILGLIILGSIVLAGILLSVIKKALSLS